MIHHVYQYPVLKLGHGIADILRGNANINMKLAKEAEKEEN